MTKQVDSMKVVLIFPPFPVHERYREKTGNVGGHLSPLGVSYLAAVLEKAGIEVKIIDAAPENIPEEEIVKKTLEFNPDFVGITALTPNFYRVEKICSILKEKSPKTFLALGGPHASMMPEETLEKTKADVVIVGEGENVIVDLVKNCKKPVKEKILKAGLVKDLDTIPFPSRHLLDMSLYSSLANNYQVDKKVINLLASRGCPFNCTFCSKSVVGRTYRHRSVKNVIEEIKHVKKEYGAKEISFWDDLLTIDRKWIMELCKEMEKLDIAWSCETRAHLVDEEMLAALKKAGCWNILVGIEAGDQTLLDNIRKEETIEQLRNGIRLIQKAGIKIRGCFMLGLPGETPELAQKTIDFAKELDTDFASFTLTTPYPGTEMAKHAKEYGTLKKDYNKYSMWKVVFLPYGYKNEEELLKMHSQAFKQFYFRPKYVLGKVLKVRSLGDIKRNFMGLKLILGFT